MTNAGRSHDVQPFTYTPDPGMLKKNSELLISSSLEGYEDQPTNK